MIVGIGKGPWKHWLLSPLLIIGLISLIFYSLLPALYLSFYLQPPAYFAKFAPDNHETALLFKGSTGELLILQFSAMCFALMAIILKTHGKRSEFIDSPMRQRRWNRIAMPVACAVILVTLLTLSARWIPAAAEIFKNGLGVELRHALAPTMSIFLASLAYIAGLNKGPYRIYSVCIILGALVGMITSGLAATAIFMTALAFALLLLIDGRLSKKLLLSLTLVSLIIPISIGVTAISRNHSDSDASQTPSARLISAQVISKLIYRQTTSGQCLDRIFSKHQNAENRDPFYFLTSIIPRSVWPEKPILSHGARYAERYCGQSNAIASGHSESITLIGEPLLNGGILGLIVAQIFAAILLGTATIFGTSNIPFRLIFMVSITPWLATFEQHFAQYFGNFLKMALIILPIVILMSWLTRARPPIKN